MIKLTRIFLISILCLLALSFHRPAQTTAQSPASEIIVLINQFRAELGLPAFRVNGTLSIAAQEQVAWMSQTGSFVHNWPNGSTPQSRANNAGYNGRVVENIVGGWDMTPRQGLIWWQNSPIHYNTIASSRYTEIGAGYVKVGNQAYYAIVVGLPGGTPRQNGGVNSEQPEPVRVIPLTLSMPSEDGAIIHPVQEGQSLWMLAAHYDVPISEILYINGLDEDDFIAPGDEIYIRLADGQAPPPTPTPPYTHIVREDETPWSIAARYGITIADFLWYNGMPQEVLLRPGDEVVIRLRDGQSPPPTSTPQLTYFVQSGDTPLGIAGRFGLTLDQLLAFNDLPAEPLLQIGQELLIRQPPVTAVPPTFTPVPTQPSATSTPPPTATPTEPAAVAQVTQPITIFTATPSPASPTPTTPSPFAFSTDTFGLGVVIFLAIGVVAVMMRRQRI